MRIPVKIVCMHGPHAAPRVPTRAYEGDAADDLYVSRDVIIAPGETKDVHTDICVQLPSNYYGRITGRSSTMRKHQLLVIEGIIDSGYTGELFICVHNVGEMFFNVTKGMRLAQFIVHEIVNTNYEPVPTLAKTERGSRGFGSSGT